MEYPVEIRGRETLEVFIQLHRKAFWWLPVFSLVMFVGYTIYIWLTEEYLAVQIGTTVIYALLAVLFWYSPNWIAKKSFKAKLKYYNGTMPEDICRFGEDILLQDPDSSQSIPYSKIKKVFFTKDCIGITLTDRRCLGIPNREFTKGSLAELKALFREKRPDLKIPE